MTVKNLTDHVVVVDGLRFSREIAIGQMIELSDEDIENDHILRFSFFSVKSRTEHTLDVERDLRGRSGLWYRAKTTIPLETVTDIETAHDIELIQRDINVCFIALFFRSLCLKRIVVAEHRRRGAHCFSSLADKRRVLRALAIESAIALQILLLLLAVLPFAFVDAWGLAETLICLAVTLAFSFVCMRNMILCHRVRRWDIRKAEINYDRSEGVHL